MVDTEDSPQASESLRSVEEDHEYFKKMLSLVPQHILQGQSYEADEVEPEEENLSSTGKESASSTAHRKSKKQRKKERKQKEKEKHCIESSEPYKQTEKHKKRKIEDRESKVSEEDAVSDSIDSENEKTNEDELTHLKHKQPRLDIPVETSPTLNGNTENQELLTNSKSESLLKHSLSKKQRKKHGVSKHSKVTESEQNSRQTTTELSINSSPGTTVFVPCPSTSHKVPDTYAPGAVSLMASSISSFEDKRAKLRAKIAELQAKRKPSDKEVLDKKRLKRQESKMKLKQKRKLEKLQKKQNQSNSSKNKGNLYKNTSPVKPVYNKEGQIVYSKFDFTESGKKEKKQSDLSGKDYKRLLEKIEKRNEKIHKLKSKDEGAGKSLEDKFKWEAAMHKAEGAKVKDNPEMLKKSLKRKEKMKEQKKKKWESRVQQVEKTKEEKQKKRTENIQKRKQSMKDKKMKKLKKKGRIIPGF